MLILLKTVRAVLCILLYLSFMLILLSNKLIVGLYLVMNVIPIMFCFTSVMWDVCLEGLFKSLFCSIVLVGTRKSWIFP